MKSKIPNPLPTIYKALATSFAIGLLELCYTRLTIPEISNILRPGQNFGPSMALVPSLKYFNLA